jgi:hypothetical protein
MSPGNHSNLNNRSDIILFVSTDPSNRGIASYRNMKFKESHVM